MSNEERITDLISEVKGKFPAITKTHSTFREMMNAAEACKLTGLDGVLNKHARVMTDIRVEIDTLLIIAQVRQLSESENKRFENIHKLNDSINEELIASLEKNCGCSRLK